MPKQLQLPNGSMHTVGQPVEEPAPEQVADAQAALADGTAEPAEPEITPCRTAFTVFLMAGGDVLVTEDLGYAEIRVERPPTFDEITYALSLVSLEYATPVRGELAKPGEWVSLTAFSPYLTHDGRWLVSADLADALVPDRASNPNERIGAAAVVLRDVATQETLGPIFGQFAQALVQSITTSVTQSVLGNMIKMGQQAAEAQGAAALAEKIEMDRQRRAGRG